MYLTLAPVKRVSPLFATKPAGVVLQKQNSGRRPQPYFTASDLTRVLAHMLTCDLWMLPHWQWLKITLRDKCKAAFLKRMADAAARVEPLGFLQWYRERIFLLDRIITLSVAYCTAGDEVAMLPFVLISSSRCRPPLTTGTYAVCAASFCWLLSFCITFTCPF